MRAHEKPTFPYEVRLQHELERIREWRNQEDRKIPDATDNNIIIATWNLTNSGLHEREAVHLEITAEILSLCKRPQNKTKVMYSTNLSWQMVQSPADMKQ